MPSSSSSAASSASGSTSQRPDHRHRHRHRASPKKKANNASARAARSVSVDQQLDALYRHAMNVEQNMPVSKDKVHALSHIKHQVNHLLSEEKKAELGARAASTPVPPPPPPPPAPAAAAAAASAAKGKGKKGGDSNDDDVVAAANNRRRYVPYPSVRDPALLAVLTRKREYRQGIAPPVVASAATADDKASASVAQRLWNERCNKGEFVLSPNQHLLKNLLSPRTPYNGLLLFHGVGVGKTCAAVTVAEQYPERPVIVVTPLHKSEFLRHVFDTELVRLGPNGMLDVTRAANQCTGMRYINRLSTGELSNQSTMKKHIENMIAARYKVLTFYAFHKEVREAFERGGGLRGVHDRFRDHVIIVDEAHRLRTEDQGIVRGKTVTTMTEEEEEDADADADADDAGVERDHGGGRGRDDQKYGEKDEVEDGEEDDDEEDALPPPPPSHIASASSGSGGSVDETAEAIAADVAMSATMMGISGQKPVTDSLRLVLQYSEGIKLLLLTATPMYNDTVDLLDLINMLLLNDKRKPLRNEQVFDATNRLTEAGARRLVNAAHGYVSYMRGDDPFAFPARFTPAASGDPAALLPAQLPTRTADDGVIPPSDRLRHTVLIGSRMGAYQAQAYRMLEDVSDDDDDDGDDREEKDDNDDEEEEEEEEDDELFWDGIYDEDDDDSGAFASSSRHHPPPRTAQQQKKQRRRRTRLETSFGLSNVTYPVDASSQPFAFGMNVKAFNSKTGFRRCFDILPGKALRVRYSAETLATPFNPFPLPFLSPEHIGRYAPKLKTIVDRILNSRGVVFVYSRYLWSGLIPLAIALEHVGISRYGDTPNVLDRPPTGEDNINAGDDGRARPRRSPPGGGSSAFGRGWTYVALTGSKDEFSTSFARDMRAATSSENVDGRVVKVILASSKAGEGLDLKFVREVHVLEPWYHFNRIEQVIGRAARNCSHAQLPLEERNLTVYLHASLPPLPPPSKRRQTPLSQQQETVDLWAYRRAEIKQRRIAEVERVLMNTAVDCPANYHALYYDPRSLGVRIDAVTSQGRTIAGYSPGDHPFDHPLYPSRWQRPSCTPVHVVTPSPTNLPERSGEGEEEGRRLMPRLRKQKDEDEDEEDVSTYDPRWHAAGIENCRNVIARLFAQGKSSSGGDRNNNNNNNSGRRNKDDNNGKRLAFTLDDIRRACFEAYPRTVSIDAVMLAVQSMLDERTPVSDVYGRDGYIIFASDKYIFQPRAAFDERDPIRRRRPPPPGSVEEASDKVSAVRFVYPPPPPPPAGSRRGRQLTETDAEGLANDNINGKNDDAAAAAAGQKDEEEEEEDARRKRKGEDGRRRRGVLPAKVEGKVGRGLLARLDQQARVLWEDTIAPTSSQNQRGADETYADAVVDYVIDRLDGVSLLHLVRLVVMVEEAAKREGAGARATTATDRPSSLSDFLPRTSLVTPQRALQSLRRGNIVLPPPPVLPPSQTGSQDGASLPVAIVYDLFTNTYLQLLAAPLHAPAKKKTKKGKEGEQRGDELHRAVVGTRYDEVRGTFLRDALRVDEGRRIAERMASGGNSSPLSDLAAYVTPTTASTAATFKVMGDTKGSSGLSCHQTSSIKIEDLARRIAHLEQEEMDEAGTAAAADRDAVVTAMTKRLDKRALCARYELALRRFRPHNFARPSVAWRLFGARRGKVRR